MTSERFSLTTKFTIVHFVVSMMVLSIFIYMTARFRYHMLVQRGRTIAEGIVLTRAWMSSYGGVWTKDSYQKNAGYLMKYHSKLGELSAYGNNTIAFMSGVNFYLHNPALATREISNLSKKSGFSWEFRVVSDRYMTPQDKPDSFEMQAIKLMEMTGAKEYYGWDGDIFRYTKALYVKRSCLTCHGSPSQIPDYILQALKAKYGNNFKRAIGYKVGQLRGIVSVKLYPENFSSVFASALDFWVILGLTVAFFTIVFFIKFEFIDRINMLTEAASKISKGELDIDLGVKDVDETKVKDQLTLLTIAIDKLRMSIKIAIERMKKHR